MADTKHTPGDWSVGERDVTVDGHPLAVIGGSRPRIIVAYVNDEANARLIAQAPALLEALKEIAKLHAPGANAQQCACAIVAQEAIEAAEKEG